MGIDGDSMGLQGLITIGRKHQVRVNLSISCLSFVDDRHDLSGGGNE
jgi:hypothetical protein